MFQKNNRKRKAALPYLRAIFGVSVVNPAAPSLAHLDILVRGMRSLSAPRLDHCETTTATATKAGGNAVSLLPASAAGLTFGVVEIDRTVRAMFGKPAGDARQTRVARDDLGRHDG